MANYFNFFPRTYYLQNTNSQSVDIVTNITSRFGFEQSFKDNTSIYYEYEIQDGDTPEIIAHKLYGSTERHWMVLNFNDIIDPQYDWPLDQRTIIEFIDTKYTPNANTQAGETGLEWAQTNDKEYLKIETRTHTPSETVVVDTIQLDANTYANVTISNNVVALEDGSTIIVAVTKQTKTYYEYELEENEKKRKIKILKPEFAPAIEEEFRRVITNNG